MICTPYSNCSGDQIEKNEMDRACSMYGERRGVYRVRWEYLRERDHLEEPDVDERKILRWIFRKWNVGVWTGSR